MKPAPRDFIESYIGGSDYWANGIRKEYKASNPDQIAFCNTFKALLQNLMAYVKEHHLTGVSWNAKGVDINSYTDDGAAASSSAAPAAKAAAPVTTTTTTTTAAAAAAGGNKADLFASLNKEGAVTSGLKKVTKDMQTWRSEYKGGDAPAPKAAPVPKKAAVEQPKGPAKLEYNSAASKWMVENQGADAGVVNIDIKDKRETVYVFGCVGAQILISGKCKSIVVDSCKKTTVTFGTAMASVEVVNCNRVNVTCTETVASIAIDKTDGIIVTVSYFCVNH